MRDGYEIFFSFWWLIFPLMGFVAVGYQSYLRHRRSQHAMEVLRTYAQQGRDPPPEVLAALTGAHQGAPYAPPPGVQPPPASAPYPPGYGPAPGYGPDPYDDWGWGGGWRARRAWRRGWRGPLWAWSRVVMFAAIAIGFGFAGQFYGPADADVAKPFTLVAVIMGVLTVGFGFIALMHTLFYRNAPRP